MGRKQKRHQLRERYMTDIFSRWKEGAYIHEINDKLEEHMRLAELTDDEHAEFVQSFHDRIYTYLIEEYQAHIRHKRATTHHLYWNVARDVVYPSIQMRLKKTLKEWIRTENNTIYDTIVDTYVRLRCHGTSLEELVARVPADTDRRTVQTRLYALIEGWQIATHELAKLAQDAQNIHTRAVSQQTRAMMESLATVVVPAEQQTMTEIRAEWTAYAPDDRLESVERDMRMWATKSYVVEPGDFLYRRTLRTVWAKIQLFPKETRGELIRRLWEECSDAEGMCAQGHISRLLNVFVGFVEHADVVCLEESFQDRMAGISRQSLPTEEKIAQATRIMDAIHMDTADRRPWLDAF